MAASAEKLRLATSSYPVGKRPFPGSITRLQ
jgi:hypothetical protein